MQRPLKKKEKEGCKTNSKKAMERLGESSKRCGADGEVEVKKKKRKSSSEAVECLGEKAKLDHSVREEELQLQLLLSLMENGGKAEKLEQFIYQFTSVRCFLFLF